MHSAHNIQKPLVTEYSVEYLWFYPFDCLADWELRSLRLTSNARVSNRMSLAQGKKIKIQNLKCGLPNACCFCTIAILKKKIRSQTINQDLSVYLIINIIEVILKESNLQTEVTCTDKCGYEVKILS